MLDPTGNSQVFRYSIAPDDVRPENERLETAIFDRIVEALLDGESDVLDGETITSFVAYKLGSLAEALSGDGNHDAAKGVAEVAVEAGYRSEDAERIYANHLTLANVHAMAGESTAASELYLEVLRLPLPGGRRDRAFAHIGLANLLTIAGDTRAALYHYERAAPVILPLLSSDEAKTFHTMLTQRYRAAADVIGLVHHAPLAGVPLPADVAIDRLLPAERHVEQVLRTWTRLRFFGEHQLAADLKRRWDRHRKESRS